MMDHKLYSHLFALIGIFVVIILFGSLSVEMAAATSQVIDLSSSKKMELTHDAPVETPSGVVLSLHLDEVQGSVTFNDTSGYGNNASCSGITCPLAGIPGVRNAALEFDGVDDYAQATTNGLPTGNQDRTMAAWVRLDSIVTSRVFFVGYGGFDIYSQIYLLYSDGQSVCFSQSGAHICGPLLDLGKWYHVAVTNIGNDITLYLDGVEVTSGTLTMNTTSNSTFYLGTVPGFYGSTHRLHGALDEILVFNRALTANEIMTIYQRGFGDIEAHKNVDKAIVHPGELVNYTITASNMITTTISNAVITDTLPLSITYSAGSLSASSGQVKSLDGVINWTGAITPSTTVTVSFEATVSPTASFGQPIINEARIAANGDTYIRTAVINIVPYKINLPCAFRACTPEYVDDFSDPTSGWPIEAGEGGSMGYQNGEYFITVDEGWIAWAMQDLGAGDFRVEVDTWPVGNHDGGVGIIFSANDNGFYLFEINDRWFSLWRIDINTWTGTTLISGNDSPYINPGNQKNHLGVVRNGSGISLYANRKFLGVVYDSTYKGTWLGMASEAWSGSFQGRFDDFSVYTGKCIGIMSGSLLQKGSASYGAVQIGSWTGHSR